MEKTNHFIFYLDNLRVMKNISQEAFVENIVSLRQYHRYISGMSKFPYTYLEDFALKLNMSADIILQNFENAKHQEAILVSTYYTHIVQRNFDKALEIKASLDSTHFLYPTSKLLYEHANNHYQYMQKQITLPDLLHRTKELINYPDILNHSVFSYNEYLILTSLLSYNDFDNQLEVYNKIKDIMNTDALVITSLNSNGYLLSLYRLSRYAGSIDNYDESIEYAFMMVNYCKQHGLYTYLDFAYLFLSIGYYYLGEMDKRDLYLKKLYFVLEVFESPGKFTNFTTSIKNFFDIDYQEFIDAHITKRD